METEINLHILLVVCGRIELAYVYFLRLIDIILSSFVVAFVIDTV